MQATNNAMNLISINIARIIGAIIANAERTKDIATPFIDVGFIVTILVFFIFLSVFYVNSFLCGDIYFVSLNPIPQTASM